MMVRTLGVAALLVVLLAAGCGTVNAVRPLAKGRSSIAFSFGGPVAKVAGMDMPLPYAVVRYRHGLSDNTSVYAGGHLLMAAFGVLGFDAGVTHHFIEQRGALPAVGVGAGLCGLIEPGGESRLLPEAELVGSFLLGGRSLTYFGVQSMFQASRDPYFVLAPFIGEEVRLGRRFSLSLESKWYAPGHDTKPCNIDYRIPIMGKGALGFVLGANYHMGGWYE
jgi:hypothetical protein